jgi:hypothetical protein
MSSPTNYNFESIEPAACMLPVNILQNLALLKDAPPGVAESTLALLGRDTVDALVELDAAECSDGTTPRQITIKPRGCELFDFCSDYAPPKSEVRDDPNKWTSENHKEKLSKAIEVLEDRGK